MQGLTIIVASADPVRFQSALEVAAASAALGRPTRLFLQSDAARLLRTGDGAPADPGTLDLLPEALALGAQVTVCQSGLALAGMRADALPDGIDTGGLVELLSGAAGDQLLMA